MVNGTWQIPSSPYRKKTIQVPIYAYQDGKLSTLIQISCAGKVVKGEPEVAHTVDSNIARARSGMTLVLLDHFCFGYSQVNC